MSVTVESITCECKCSLHIILECETEGKKKKKKKKKRRNNKLSPVCHILFTYSHGLFTLALNLVISSSYQIDINSKCSLLFVLCTNVHYYFIISWFYFKEIYDLIDFASFAHIEMSGLHSTFCSSIMYINIYHTIT